MDFRWQCHLSPCSVVQTSTPTSWRKLSILFLKSPSAEWDLWAVSLGYSGREESGEFMKRHQEDYKEVSSRIFHLKVRMGCDPWLWPLMRRKELITNIMVILPGEEWVFSMQSIAWEQMIQKELKVPKTWRSTGFGYLFSVQISSYSFPLNCNTYHTCFSLTGCFLFHPCFQSFLTRILTAGFILIGLHISQP